MSNVELFRRYKLQNPGKYASKYGNKTPEEVASGAQPEIESPIKFTVKPLKELETSFAPAPEFAPEPDAVHPDVDNIAPPKKAKKSKKNAV